jgi:hypothetical protein
MQRRLNALSDYLSSRKYTESSLRGVERLKSSINIDREQASDAIAQLEDVSLEFHADQIILLTQDVGSYQ